MAGILNVVGALTGTAVAATVGKGIVAPENTTQLLVIAALLAAIIWDLITWRYGIPSSFSHALIFSIVGAGVAAAGSSSSGKQPFWSFADFFSGLGCLQSRWQRCAEDHGCDHDGADKLSWVEGQSMAGAALDHTRLSYRDEDGYSHWRVADYTDCWSESSRTAPDSWFCC